MMGEKAPISAHLMNNSGVLLSHSKEVKPPVSKCTNFTPHMPMLNMAGITEASPSLFDQSTF